MPSTAKTLSQAALLVAVFGLTGCATLDGLMSGLGKKAGETVVPFSERPLNDPIEANIFTLLTPEQTVIGEPQIVLAGKNDTFSDLARTYGLGYDDILEANPGIDPWLPGEGTAILLPTQYILPNAPQRGVILNIATKRLFYYPLPAEGKPQQVFTYPIGIGRVGWETPLGETTVVSKAKDPTWWVPASVRKEHAEMGDPLPSIVPPGPDNPLGTRVLKLNMPGYLIHGTNQPYGVGMRVSHGCVRLYPENIEFLYSLVEVGEVVTILNEPYQFGRRDGATYFEAHTPLEDDSVPAEQRLQTLLDAMQASTSDGTFNDHLRQHVISLAADPIGVPTNIAMYDAAEVMTRVRVVHNIVERDPNEPTLAEVREMMDEIESADDALSSGE